MAQEAVDRQGIEVIIDRLFSCMQGYMYEFNKVAVGTELACFWHHIRRSN